MFENLTGLDITTMTPRHLVPERGQSMVNYATQVANHLEVTDNDVVGGCSFGGLVASAIARQRTVRGLVLIGSTLDGSGLNSGRGLGLIKLIPPRLLRRLLCSDHLMQKMFAPEDEEVRRLAREMMQETPAPLLVYGSRMMVGYRPADEVPCPVFAIHGAKDPIMSPPCVANCQILADAGHAIVWTHGGLVGKFLQSALESCMEEDAGSPPSG